LVGGASNDVWRIQRFGPVVTVHQHSAIVIAQLRPAIVRCRRRSHTGIIIFVQNAPIIWYSKRQNTVESSTFGSEFVALRTARDLIVSLRFKLRMFGVPLVGPTDVLCDNAGVVKNTSVPESVLSKRHNAINYHVVRESAAAGILRVGKEDGETNLADAFTKILPRDRRINLFSRILYSRDFIHDDLYGGVVVSTQTNDC